MEYGYGSLPFSFTPGSKVFYLGAALGITVSHISDIVGLALSIASVLQLAFQSIGVVYGDITILDTIEQVGGIYVVTADHGNAEDMVKRNKNKKGGPLLDKDGNIQILTSHTLQPVLVAIGGPGLATGIRFRKDVPNGLSLLL